MTTAVQQVFLDDVATRLRARYPDQEVVVRDGTDVLASYPRTLDVAVTLSGSRSSFVYQMPVAHEFIDDEPEAAAIVVEVLARHLQRAKTRGRG